MTRGSISCIWDKNCLDRQQMWESLWREIMDHYHIPPYFFIYSAPVWGFLTEVCHRRSQVGEVWPLCWLRWNKVRQRQSLLHQLINFARRAPQICPVEVLCYLSRIDWSLSMIMAQNGDLSRKIYKPWTSVLSEMSNKCCFSSHWRLLNIVFWLVNEVKWMDH